MARGLSGIIYGLAGMGKTSLGLRFPGPVFCKSIFESGYDTLSKVPENTDNENIKSFQQLVTSTKSVNKGTILIDSCTGLQRLIFEHATLMDYKGNPQAFFDYSKGPRQEAVRYLQAYLDLCDNLCDKGVNVIFLAHQVTISLPNSMGPDYLSHEIAMDGSDKGGMRNTIVAWASFIFFLNKQVTITQATETIKGSVTEGKASSDTGRYIYTDLSTSHSAKNRWDMTSCIPMGRNADEAASNLFKQIPERFGGSKKD
jgi:hypothetical protein